MALPLAARSHAHSHARTLTCFVFFPTDFRTKERDCSQSSILSQDVNQFQTLKPTVTKEVRQRIILIKVTLKTQMKTSKMVMYCVRKRRRNSAAQDVKINKTNWSKVKTQILIFSGTELLYQKITQKKIVALDIICSSKFTVFLELRSRKTVRLSEQIMSVDKYPCIFSSQMETIVYIISAH